MKLNTKGFALAAGVMSGLVVLLATLLSLWRSGQHAGILHHVFFGYSVSYSGCVIGLVYGLVAGLAGGAAFAWLYNRI
jgi:hypothetical protein